MKIKHIVYISWLFLPSLKSVAQENLEDILNSQVEATTDYASATFKATRIMLGQSIESMPQGQLDFRIHHRFGTINQGGYNMWGLDGANTFFSLEYGINNWLMAGVGRGTFEKTFNGFVKMKLWRQSTGKVERPVSVDWYSSIEDRSQDFQQNNSLYPYSTRLSFVNQALIARKFNNNFSFQFTPTHIHYNLVPTEMDPHDLFSLGMGARMKLTNRISVNAEYYYVYRPNKFASVAYNNPLSLGIDIETGGHVFQLIFTNSDGMTEKEFIGRTTGRWNKGDIHFGFNISRVFDINHHKEKAN
jgi:hypothetical protein